MTVQPVHAHSPRDPGANDEPLRIALVVAGLGAGGAERVISLLARNWVARGHDVTVVAFDDETDPIFHGLSEGIRVVRLGIPGSGSGRWLSFQSIVRRCRALRRTLDELSPEITISFLTKINVLTLLASLGTDRYVAVSERNNPRLQRASRLWTWALAGLHWRANAIVMQTRASLECLDARSRRRARVIPNPIEIVPQPAPPRSSFTLAATGRLTWQKGFDLLIDAFAKVADRHPSWNLVIWGEGNAREDLEQKVRDRGLADRISLPGNSASPGEWAGQADAFVLSSRYEGFCNALGEAMAAGLPVISFNCDYGPSDVISDGLDGLLVDNGDVPALSAAMDRLMGDPQLRTRLGKGALATGKRFDPQVIVAQWDHCVLGKVRKEASLAGR